jgi:hypothetical protein
VCVDLDLATVRPVLPPHLHRRRQGAGSAASRRTRRRVGRPPPLHGRTDVRSFRFLRSSTTWSCSALVLCSRASNCAAPRAAVAVGAGFLAPERDLVSFQLRAGCPGSPSLCTCSAGHSVERAAGTLLGKGDPGCWRSEFFKRRPAAFLLLVLGACRGLEVAFVLTFV